MCITTKVWYTNYIDCEGIQNAPSFHIFASIKPGKLKSLSLASQTLQAITCPKYEYLCCLCSIMDKIQIFLLPSGSTWKPRRFTQGNTCCQKIDHIYQATMKVNLGDKLRIPSCLNWHTLRRQPTFALTNNLSLTSKRGERKLQDMKGNWALDKLIPQLLSLKHYLPSPKGVIYAVKIQIHR